MKTPIQQVIDEIQKMELNTNNKECLYMLVSLNVIALTLLQEEKQNIIKAWKSGDGGHDKVADKLSLEYYNNTYGGNK